MTKTPRSSTAASSHRIAEISAEQNMEVGAFVFGAAHALVFERMPS
ncbi:hypothetical protein [Microbacterium sp. PM5]|nr:hypothetical protein [Microbacterium sp. PM5]